MKVGVLALQGAFIEHIKILESLNCEAVEVRQAKQLESIDALIIPGGESTTIARLAEDFNLINDLQNFVETKPVWGTCAGLIFLAKDVGTKQKTLGVLDVKVARNAFGRQAESFSTDLLFSFLDQPEESFPAVFIRAPLIESVGASVEVLAELEKGQIIAVKQGNILATSFHPELSGDSRFHQYFLDMIE